MPLLTSSPNRRCDYLPGMVAAILVLVAAWVNGPAVQAHEVYLMNSNHTDYNWNATAAQYDAAMLDELDYYLDQITNTAGNPPAEQARYTTDNWWWMYLYENNRSTNQFNKLISAIKSGHITVPLNPFVTLYGALPTEAVIRAGYYPGRMERQRGITFLLGENTENHTNPWGLVSIWAGSGVRYGWKGVCGCVQSAPSRDDVELFYWQGPDNKKILFKWYELLGFNSDWGGYSEARDNVDSPSDINASIQRTQTRMPGISFTGLFGAGWDDFTWMNSNVVDAVVAYNNTASPDTARVSNGIDFFQALEASGQTSGLTTLRGGWGNDWDMWPASLAERTSRNRRALELLRTAELLAAWVHIFDNTFWPPVRDEIEAGLMSTWKFFEHGWNVTTGGPTLQQMQADKEQWTQDLENAVVGAVSDTDSELSSLFDTPSNQDRLAVFNPLGFTRTDFADYQVADGDLGPFRVTIVGTSTEVPSQVIQRNGNTYLRFLAQNVPSLGYRLFRLWRQAPTSKPDAAVVNELAQSIDGDFYRVVLDNKAQITTAQDKKNQNRELAGSSALLRNYWSGTVDQAVAENVGPVSTTLYLTLSNPSREVRITLFKSIDRIEIEHAITQNETGDRLLSFQSNLAGSQIRFEEIGAVARPGLKNQGGDFLQGTRASRMTLNHFVDFAQNDYHMVLSNWDAFAMQVNNSDDEVFRLAGNTIHVVVMERQTGAGPDQGGDDFFLNRFALRGLSGGFNGAETMRTSLAHQNPLYVVELPRDNNGPITASTGSLLAIDSNNLVVTALKPAEDSGAGFVVRLWELQDRITYVRLDATSTGFQSAWETSHVETDQKGLVVDGGSIFSLVEPNEIQTIRFSNQPGDVLFSDGFESGNLSGWSAHTP